MVELTGLAIALSVIIAVGLIAFVGTLSAWATSFFVQNHKVRVAQHKPLGSYYRGLALGH